jgi:hypothetical protein
MSGTDNDRLLTKLIHTVRNGARQDFRQSR